ncbi:FAD-dependent oxidoreductase [Chloroflexota bacterium]
MQELRHVFQPIKIGSMEVKNRIVMPGMGVGFGIDDEGCPTPQLTEYLVERARNRPGMIVSGVIGVHPLGVTDQSQFRELHLWEDKAMPSMEQMVRAVHKYDVKFGAQLMHIGIGSGLPEAVGPSAVPVFVWDNYLPREASTNEIGEFVEAFGRAAERCVKVGFDFVEIHAAHAYLINQFLTPHYNRRTDEYGGSFNNRIRFLLEVIHEVRERVGDEFPIGVRINGDDFLKEGDRWTLTDLCRLAPILEQESVNYLNISVGGLIYNAIKFTIPSMYADQGLYVYLSEEVKKHVSIPVAIVGRIKDPMMADRIIMEGKADLVCMGRAHIADPEIVEKARNGRISDIRLCLGDCLGCIEGVLKIGGEASCTVNPRMGREYLIKDIEGEKRNLAKKVLVAGAGCAGLEAARRAAFSGHRVIICENSGRIGGQLSWASMMPKRQEMGDILRWYERQLHKLGVEIRLNTPVNDDLLDQIGPQVLVIATGSLPEVGLGFIEGLDNIKDIELLTVDELLEEERLTGDTVLVIGGDQIGLQVADYLSEMDKKVYVAERGAYFAEKMAANDRFYLKGRIIDKDVKTYRRVRMVEILPTDEVWIVNDKGREKLPEIDTIVLASDRRPNTFLAELAERKGIETHIVGDACGVSGQGQGTVLTAIAAGYEVGRQV